MYSTVLAFRSLEPIASRHGREPFRLVEFRGKRQRSSGNAYRDLKYSMALSRTSSRFGESDSVPQSGVECRSLGRVRTCHRPFRFQLADWLVMAGLDAIHYLAGSYPKCPPNHQIRRGILR